MKCEPTTLVSTALMNPRASLVALVISCTLEVGASAQIQIASIEPLPGGSESRAFATSGDGCVVFGESHFHGTSNRPIRWTWGGGTADMGVIEPPPYPVQMSYYVTGSNWDGSVAVGYVSEFMGDFRYMAFMWTQAHGISALNIGLGPDDFVTAEGVSDDGRMIVGGTSQGAYLFDGEVARILWNGYATAVSGDGLVVVGTQSIDGELHAIRWTEQTGAIDIGVFAPMVVNWDGSVIAGEIRTFPTAAVRWSSDQGMRVLPLVAGTAEPAARGITLDGSVIVGGIVRGSSRAVQWEDEGTPTELELLAGEEASAGGWQLSYASGISAEGLIIAGNGRRGDPVVERGWVLRLGPRCGSSDFNHDGEAGTDADIEAFFACLAGTCCPGCESVDFNGDNDSGTDLDIEAFFRSLAGQPC